MKNFITAFLVFIVWSFFGLWLYSWLEPDIKTTVAATNIEPTHVLDVQNKKTSRPNTESISSEEPNKEISSDEVRLETDVAVEGLLAISETGDPIFLYSEGIEIEKNSKTVRIPEKTLPFIKKTKNYLETHPNKEVHIISLYDVTENNESPNLGIQRGKFIKRLMLNDGIPSEKIVVKSVIRDLAFTVANTFNNGISLAFRPLDQNRIDAIVPELPDAIVVYPKFSGTKVMENNNLKNLVTQIENALEMNPEVSIEVIGHTDNIGSAAENYQLGLKFARQVRWYLVNKTNLENTKITASSKGESESIDTNSTTRGRMANQRIEVVFY